MRKKTVYVASSIDKSGTLLNKVIQAESIEEAKKIFINETSISPKEIFGPFYEKNKTTYSKELKFSNKTKKAIFRDWIVNAFLLEDPKDHAYLIFIKRVDDKKDSPPSGIITVPISDLRIING